MKRSIVVVFALASTTPVFGEDRCSSDAGLATDVMLHPGDGFTAYTLCKNQLIYNQYLWTIPVTPFIWWGVTDWLTVELDTEAYLGGLFIEPHLPIPSFDVRLRLYGDARSQFALAYETMIQHLWSPIEQLDEPIRIERAGTSWFHHVNASVRVADATYLHASAGATFSRALVLEDPHSGRRRSFRDLVSPDASLTLDWRVSPRISLHASASYGSTFTYLDNVPRKLQAAVAVRVAPFYAARHGFLRRMRFELASLLWHFPDIGTSAWIPPIFPYVYWNLG